MKLFRRKQKHAYSHALGRELSASVFPGFADRIKHYFAEIEIDEEDSVTKRKELRRIMDTFHNCLRVSLKYRILALGNEKRGGSDVAEESEEEDEDGEDDDNDTDENVNGDNVGDGDDDESHSKDVARARTNTKAKRQAATNHGAEKRLSLRRSAPERIVDELCAVPSVLPGFRITQFRIRLSTAWRITPPPSSSSFRVASSSNRSAALQSAGVAKLLCANSYEERLKLVHVLSELCRRESTLLVAAASPSNNNANNNAVAQASGSANEVQQLDYLNWQQTCSAAANKIAGGQTRGVTQLDEAAAAALAHSNSASNLPFYQNQSNARCVSSRASSSRRSSSTRSSPHRQEVLAFLSTITNSQPKSFVQHHPRSGSFQVGSGGVSALATATAGGEGGGGGADSGSLGTVKDPLPVTVLSQGVTVIPFSSSTPHHQQQQHTHRHVQFNQSVMPGSASSSNLLHNATASSGNTSTVTAKSPWNAEDLQQFAWFHPELDRTNSSQLVVAAAVKSVEASGVFLVRPSDTLHGEFVLTVNCVGKAKHLRLVLDKANSSCSVQHLRFNSLLDLLCHFRKDPIPLETTAATSPAEHHTTVNHNNPATSSNSAVNSQSQLSTLMGGSGASSGGSANQHSQSQTQSQQVTVRLGSFVVNSKFAPVSPPLYDMPPSLQGGRERESSIDSASIWICSGPVEQCGRPDYSHLKLI